MGNKKINNNEENIETTNVESKVKKFFNKTRVTALIKLGLYVIFFIVVLMMINQDRKTINNMKSKDSLTDFSQYINYEASYDITKSINEEETNLYIEMMRYDNKYAIVFDGGSSYFVENKSYKYDDLNKEFVLSDDDFTDLYKLNPDKLFTLISGGELISKGKILNTEIIKKKYLIEETNNFYISTYEENDIINGILVEYDNKEYSYEIEIDYSNIGKVENFDKK